MNFRYTFVYCVLTCCLVAGESPIYGLQGKAVELKTEIKTQPDEILWKHNGNKVLEFNGNEETAYGSFKDRVTLDWLSADLNIEGLTYDDSGDYELEVFTKTILQRTSYKLQVIDEVGKPTITCKMNKDNSSDGSGKSATLMCSAESRQFQSLMTFEWSSNGNKHHGQNFMIPLGDGHGGEEHTCTVSNPLTTESTVFNAEECYPVKDTQTLLIVIISLVCLLIFILVVVTLWFLWHKGYFSKKGKADVEKQTLHDDGANREVKHLIDRAPTMPSHQKLGHLNPPNKDDHSDSENTTESFVEMPKNEMEQLIQQQEPGFDKKKDKNERKTPPGGVSATPCPFLDLSVNNQEPADEAKLIEAAEREDSDKENNALSGELDDCSKDEEGRTSSPTDVSPAPPPDPDVSVNDQKLADEDEHKEATERESEKEEDGLPGKDKDSKTSSPPPVASRPPDVVDPALNDQEPADEDELKEATEKEDSESDSSDSEKKNDTLPSLTPPPVVDSPVKDPEPADEDKLKETTEKEDYDDYSSNSKNAEDVSPGKDKESRNSSPPPVAPKPHHALDFSVKDPEPDDEDKLKEATEKEHSEGGSSDSKKADDASPGKDKESRNSSPPPVAPKPHHALDFSVKDPEPDDEDKLKEATEKEHSEGGSSDSKKADDASPGKDKERRNSSPPPVAPKPHHALDFSVKDPEPDDEDKLKEATEKEHSVGGSSDSKKADDASPGKDKDSKIPCPPPVAPVKTLISKFEEGIQQHTPPAESDKEKEATLASDIDVSPPATQPHSTSTQNTPNMAPKDDADKHTEDTRSDVVAEVDPEKSGT